MNTLQQCRKSQGLCINCGEPAYIKPNDDPAIVCASCLMKKEARWKRNYRIKRLGIGGKWVGGFNKRAYSEICEVCGGGGVLVYHHWDDSNPNKGLWLCRRCHSIAEIIDRIDSGGKDIDPVVLVAKYRMKRDALDTPLETKKEPLFV